MKRSAVVSATAVIKWLIAELVCNGFAKPNFIIFFADDMGYGDLQSYGHPSQEKGGIDEMAEEGMRFTHWYSADGMCSPSRAALLTGRLPIRSGIVGPQRVFWQFGAGGLPKSEKTIAENLQLVGYKTGIVGKWHLGINEHHVNDGNHLPKHHGFEYEGTVLPYGQNWKCDPKRFSVEEMSEKCFKYVNGTFVQQPIIMKHLTSEMVQDAKHFIDLATAEDQPFFLYLPLIQAHCSLFCDNHFCGKSKRGLYGDTINEMSWAVHEILGKVKDLNLQENTLAFFTSDNGPQIESCTDGGSAGVFQGGKASTWEGGIRMPAIAWWPGTVPAGNVSDSILSTMDIYPTIMHYAGYDTTEETLDGINIADIITARENIADRSILFHYCSNRIMAVQYGRYKLHFYTQRHVNNFEESCLDGKILDDVLSYLPCEGNNVDSHDPPLIFDVETDPAEKYPLKATKFAEIIETVNVLIAEHKSTIVEVPSQLGYNDVALQPCCKPPDCVCNYDISEQPHAEL